MDVPATAKVKALRWDASPWEKHWGFATLITDAWVIYSNLMGDHPPKSCLGLDLINFISTNQVAWDYNRRLQPKKFQQDCKTCVILELVKTSGALFLPAQKAGSCFQSCAFLGWLLRRGFQVTPETGWVDTKNRRRHPSYGAFGSWQSPRRFICAAPGTLSGESRRFFALGMLLGTELILGSIAFFLNQRNHVSYVSWRVRTRNHYVHRFQHFEWC